VLQQILPKAAIGPVARIAVEAVDEQDRKWTGHANLLAGVWDQASGF
jgi:hypothetical protein